MNKWPPRLSKDQLLEKYSNRELRLRILDLLDLQTFLSQCIISSDYKISDALNNALAFTDYGEDTLREFGKKSIPTKEGRLICFLEFFHVDLLVDPMKIQPDLLAKAIGNEIRTGRIRLPFIHGPLLYERAADLYTEERSYLDSSETDRLISGTPHGVFQMGRWVSGPKGLLESRQSRFMRPTLIIPLQHCHDVSCVSVHKVQLTTDYTADVNEHRNAAGKILRTQCEEPSEFYIYFSEISRNFKDHFNDANTGSLPYLIGSVFSDDELRILMRQLLDHTQGEFREVLAKVGVVGRSDQWADNCDRADILQQILLLKDETLIRAIDHLVYRKGGGIEVPDGEIRNSVLFRNASSGAFSTRAQLSSAGVRFQGHRDLAPLRLRRLVNDVFAEERSGRTEEKSFEDNEELSWQLRSVPGANATSKLEEYLRTEEPAHVLERLILSRRKRVLTAARNLQMDIDDDIDDDVLLHRLLWKLGFDPHFEDGEYAAFIAKHVRISQTVKSAQVSTVVDWESIRGLAANYFVELERILHDTIAYTTWVLTSDHASAAHPFTYNHETEYANALSKLTDFELDRSSPDQDPMRFDNSATLDPLCSGFRIVADLLESSQEKQREYLRPSGSFPDYHANTRLRAFPFKHTMLFLDLTDVARTHVVALLRNTSALLCDVPSVRNGQLHHRPSPADLSKFHDCLTNVLRAFEELENAGFVRSLFRLDRHESDRWGRRTYYFKNSASREIALPWPTPYAWLNLPRLASPQYIVTAAQFDEPREVIRVRPSYTSEYTNLWSKFPQRRRSSGRDSRLGYESQELSGQQESKIILE